MKEYFHLLLLISLLCLSSDLQGQNPVESLETHPNQYFVKLCGGLSNQEINTTLAELNSVELWKNDKIGLRLWAVKKFPYSCTDGEISDINGHMVRSRRKTNINGVVEDMIFELEGINFDGKDDFFEDMELGGETGSNPIRIAILDSGISDEAMSKNKINISYTGYDYVNNDSIPDDENGHGTHIAGIIYNILDQSGSADDIYYDIRKTHNIEGFGNISNLISATIDAVDAGADIINMSFSYYENLSDEDLNPLQLAIDYAEQHGVLIIASAGNMGLNNDNMDAAPVPATFHNENILSVASNSKHGSLSYFSNYGANSVDVSILGERIPAPSLGGKQKFVSGTSFSTAIVSGLSAIMGTQQDQFNACEIKCILMSTSTPVNEFQGLCKSGGVIDFEEALEDAPSECGAVCQDAAPITLYSCGVNCPPVTNDMDICVRPTLTVTDQLLVYDNEQDPITIMEQPVYGPFKGSVVIHPDGSFSYTSNEGEADMFVYQVCDNIPTECSDGCNQGVVYVNTPACRSLFDNEDIQDCADLEGYPKILTFRYTGEDCMVSDYHQNPDKVDCSGDPAFAPVVYVTAEAEDSYFSGLEVPLNGTFSIDAANVGDVKMKASTRIYIKDSQGNTLQTIELQTDGHEPLAINDQFGSLLLEGVLSTADITCGNVNMENRNIYDCKVETGGYPKLLTFRYTGQECTATDHAQDPEKVDCSGSPAFAPVVYVTAEGESNYIYNLEVPLDSTFSIAAADVGDSKLQSSVTVYLKDILGTVLQTITFQIDGSEPLGVNDQFGSLLLEGFLADNGNICGNVDHLENREIYDCKQATGKKPKILTFRYTGQDCMVTNHAQDADEVNCSGDPAFTPLVYVAAFGVDAFGIEITYFTDLEVPLDGTFSIDAAKFGESELKGSTVIYIKNVQGVVLQTIELKIDGSEPLGINDQFGSLVLEGYYSSENTMCGNVNMENRTITDCNVDTQGNPKLLTFRYTGQDCSASDNAQDRKMVDCDGDPAFAPTVYVTAEGIKFTDNGKVIQNYFTNLEVTLEGTFSVAAADIDINKLRDLTIIYIKDNLGTELQTIEFRTDGHEPLGIKDQFGSLVLEGYQADNDLIRGNPEDLERDIYDCKDETGGNPKILTFRYTGQGCIASNHAQDSDEVECDGDPDFAPIVYVTAEGIKFTNNGEEIQNYFTNLEVPLNGTFPIDAAIIEENKLKELTIIYVKDNLGETLQTISIQTKGDEPLGINDQFGSLVLEGYYSTNNAMCGNVNLEIRDIPNCKVETGDNPKLLTFRYTGQDCTASDHAQDADEVDCDGDPAFAPVVYVTVVGDEKTYFTDREVTLDSTFSIAATDIGEDQLESFVTFYLKDSQGTELQTIAFRVDGSELLGVNDQFASLVLEGFLAKNGNICGNVDHLDRFIYDCKNETGGEPKLLTFRYTGQDCTASDHSQDSDIDCDGDPAYAQTVYVTVVGEGYTYFTDREVALDSTFSIAAADVGEDQLEASVIFYLKDSQGTVLQTIEFQVDGSEPLGVTDQFGSLALEGFLAKNGNICGNVDHLDRIPFDCRNETGGNPKSLTFRYTGQDCTASDHSQDSDIDCDGDPAYAPLVYIMAVGEDEKYYAINQEVALDGTFSINAADVGDIQLGELTTFYLKDVQGTILQTIVFQTGGGEPLGVEDQFGSLVLVGYTAENGNVCGEPETRSTDGDCCEDTGKLPQILTFQYTGDGCGATNHHQNPDSVICSGDPDFAPFVYITVESRDEHEVNKIFFRDLQLPINGIFDIDAVSMGENEMPSSIAIYLKDGIGNVLQEIEIHTSCSEPLGIGDRFGALRLKGYMTEEGDQRGDDPVSVVCNPVFECLAIGKRSAIGLIYLGNTSTTVRAYSKAAGEELIGTYEEVNPGDFMVFSAASRNKTYFGHFFLQWSEDMEIEIPVETSVEILGEMYGDFQVVQQLDQRGNDCRIPYSSCMELNRQCGMDEVLSRQGQNQTSLDDLSFGHSKIDGMQGKDILNQIDDIQDKEVRLFPNPTSGNFYIDLSQYTGQEMIIGIYDSVSRLIKRLRVAEATATPLVVEVKDMPVGMYNVLIHPDEGVPVLKKLVIVVNE